MTTGMSSHSNSQITIITPRTCSQKIGQNPGKTAFVTGALATTTTALFNGLSGVCGAGGMFAAATETVTTLAAGSAGATAVCVAAPAVIAGLTTAGLVYGGMKLYAHCFPSANLEAYQTMNDNSRMTP